MKVKTALVFYILLIPLLFLLNGCSGTSEGKNSPTDGSTMLDAAVTSHSSDITGTSEESFVSDSLTEENTGKTEETYNNTTIITAATTETTIPKNSVSLVVQCKEALDFINQKGGNAPSLNYKDGVILQKNNIEVSENESVLDVLKKVAKENNIFVDEKYGYVKGIDGLVAKDKYFGEQSGWLYFINGTAPGKSSADILVNAGDIIEFRYICSAYNF
jgi:hypothetical protein